MSGFEEPRVLWDYQWVRDGCVGTPPVGTNVDNSFGCYITNYLILGVGVGAAVMSLLEPPSPSKGLRAVSFALTGMGYGLAGVLHQFLVTEESTTSPAGDLGWRVSYALTVLGVLPLGVIANLALEAKLSCPPCCRWVGVGVLSALGAVVLGATFLLADPPIMVVGVFHLLVLLYFMIVSATMCDCGCVAGAALMIAGLAVQVLLSPTCGNKGYESCWSDCPLPAPWFNHNALFHLIFAIGLLVVAVVMAAMEARSSDTEDRSKFMGLPTD